MKNTVVQSIVILLCLTLGKKEANAEVLLSLSEDQVIEWTLQKSFTKKSIDLQFQKAHSALLFSEAVWDPMLTVSGGYEDSRAKLISGFNNNHDQTHNLTFAINKKFRTGTWLGFDYTYMNKSSDLSTAFKALGIQPELYQNIGSFRFKQELWNNYFGANDRKKNQSAQINYEKSQLDHQEAVEDLVMGSLQLFWQTYMAKENYLQSLAAREKYLILYNKVSQKNKMGFDDKAEFVRTKAELENQERNIKSALLLYQNLLSQLLVHLNQPVATDINFQVKEELPPVPPLKTDPQVEKLRKIQSAEKLISASQLENEITVNADQPTLNFVAQTGAYGLDSQQSESLSQMNKYNNNKYYVGLEFSMKLDSSANQGEALLKKIQFDEAQNQKNKLEENLKESLKTSQNNLVHKYLIARKALDTVGIWETVVKSQEANHRFGRVSTAELIMDYQSFFRSKGLLSAAIADYHMALQEYLSTRDELIK